MNCDVQDSRSRAVYDVIDRPYSNRKLPFLWEKLHVLDAIKIRVLCPQNSLMFSRGGKNHAVGER
jgi:hypothetical protein